MKNYRRLPLNGALNCRDLGGYPAEEGKMTSYHVFYRSDGLYQLTETDWKLLYEYGVRVILDLRSASETSHQSYQSAGYGIETFSVPLQSQEINLEDLMKRLKGADEAFIRSMTMDYSDMVRSNPAGIARILNLAVESLEKGAVLFHCTAGKDRTGILTALLFLLCGVPEVDIVADYQVTWTYIKSMIQSMWGDNACIPLMRSPAENMEQLLVWFKKDQIWKLLEQHGWKKENAELLKRRFLE